MSRPVGSRTPRILVQGGAGAVGSAAILLAKWAGAWVATTVRRSEQADVARAAGADLVVILDEDGMVDIIHDATAGLGVDRIIDVSIMSNLAIDMACLSSGGTIVSYAVHDASDHMSVPLLKAMVGGCVFRFVYIYTVSQEAKRQAIIDITACLKAGGYRPAIGLRLPLADIARAHDAQESGTVVGKIILDIVEALPMTCASA